jgi:hypothetical protein
MAKSKADYIEQGRADAAAKVERNTRFTRNSWQENAYDAGYNAEFKRQASGEPAEKVGDTRTNADGSVSTLVEGAPGTVPAWLTRVAPCPPGNLPEFHACPPGGIPCPGPKSIKPFTHGHWHAWQGQTGVMLSHEKTKNLREFNTADGCINWLYLNDFKEAARALNAHVKGV